MWSAVTVHMLVTFPIYSYMVPTYWATFLIYSYMVQTYWVIHTQTDNLNNQVTSHIHIHSYILHNYDMVMTLYHTAVAVPLFTHTF